MASLSSLAGLRIGVTSCAVSQHQDDHHHDHHYLSSSPLSFWPSAWLAARMPHSSDGASAAVAAAVSTPSSEKPAASSNSRSRHGVLPPCLVAASALAAVALSWGGSALAHPSLLHQALDEENHTAPVHLLRSGAAMESAFPHAGITWLSSAEAPPVEPSSADCVTVPPSSIPAPTTKRAPPAEVVSNELIVAEAWQVVNERFLDARHHKWSQDAWAKKKDEVLRRPIPSRMAAYSVIRNMLSELDDPYTRFITPKELKQLSKYDMTGIGISLGEIGESTKTPLHVVGIVFGSPAELAGIKQGDEILSVDGIDVQGKSAFEASSLIQGVKGTLVSIEVKHGPCGEIQRFSIERQQSVQTPVYYHLEQRAGNIVGYMRVKEFNAVAKRDMVTAMDRLKAAGATSFLLDLRDNPGGLVQAGVEIAKAFLDKESTVVYTVGRDPGAQKQIIANGIPLTTDPLMVLVNDHTASASEIVAAALHDNCRAVLVGQKTFGKGLIQSVFELSDGSGVILTVGKYVTPHHQDIDGNGIEPDFRVLPSKASIKLKRAINATHSD